MARFFFKANDNLIVVNNVAYHNDFFVEQESGNIIINIVKENTDDYAYMPFFGVISLDEKEPKVYGKFKLIDWQNNNFEVVYKLDKQPFYVPPTALYEKTYKSPTENLRVTLYKDSSMHLLYESDYSTARYDVPDLTTPNTYFRQLSKGVLIVTRATTIQDDYLNINYYNTKFNNLFSESCKKVEFLNDFFTTTKDINDMIGRQEITKYTFTNSHIKILSKKFLYENDKIYPDELLPYLLLESIKVKDFDKAKDYLSNDLIENIDYLDDYFGHFDEIVCPKYCDNTKKSDLLKVALLYKNDSTIIKPKFFNFLITDGKISNIED